MEIILLIIGCYAAGKVISSISGILLIALLGEEGKL